MTYRGVVRHVRYWRGKVHRWSTVYQFVGTASRGLTASDCSALLTADSGMCYAGSGVQGGAYEAQFYNQAVGGVPVASYTAFDWASPGAWVPYTQASWSTSGIGQDPVAETALLVEWPAGISKSGKPVLLRKWYHAVPAEQANGANAQVSAGDIASLTAGATALMGVVGGAGLALGTSSGRFAGNPRVSPFYANHQMARGRRRTKQQLLNAALGKYLVHGNQDVSGGQIVDEG